MNILLKQKQMLLGMIILLMFGIVFSTNEAQIAIAGILYVCFLQMHFIKKEDRAGKQIVTLLCLLLVVGVMIGISLLAHSLLFEGEFLIEFILSGLTTYGASCLIVGMVFVLLQEFLSLEVQKVILTIGLVYLLALTLFTKGIFKTIPVSIPVEYHYQPPWDLICIAVMFFVIGCVLECIISHMKHKYNESESIDL